MVKVQTIQSNYNAVSERGLSSNFARKQNFGTSKKFAISKEAEKIILNGVETEIDKKTGKFGSFLKWLADTKGEEQTQLINALFTTTLAPFWIVNNPFPSKKTKDEKRYLAWRQPISATIALTITLAMTKLMNAGMDKWYNEGFSKRIDLRQNPDKYYLKSYFKKAYKEAKNQGRLKEFLETYDSDVSESIKAKGFRNGKPSWFYKLGCRAGFVKKVQAQRQELFTRLITSNNIDLSGNNIRIGSEDLQKGHLVRISETKDLRDYINKNNLHNTSFKDFMKERFGFEFYGSNEGELSGRMKSHISESKLSEIKAIDFLKEIGLIEEGKVGEEELREALLRIRQTRNSGRLAKTMKTSEKTAKEAFEIFGSDASRNAQMTVGDEIGKAKSINLGHFFHQLGYYTAKDNVHSRTIQELMDKPMAEVLNEFSKVFKGKLRNFDEKAVLKDFAKNMLKVTSKRLATNATNHKFYINIFFNLFSTAVSCSVLNWAYPRFMEAFCPNLTKKVKKGGNK